MGSRVETGQEGHSHLLNTWRLVAQEGHGLTLCPLLRSDGGWLLSL